MYIYVDKYTLGRFSCSLGEFTYTHVYVHVIVVAVQVLVHVHVPEHIPTCVYEKTKPCFTPPGELALIH